MAKEFIKDFYGRVLGSYETLSDGTVILRDFHGRMKGKYDPKQNVTRDFYGHVVAKGNHLSMLLDKGNK